MTTAEVAVVCRTSAATLRYWRQVGRGPRCFKLGKRVLYETADVEAWLADAQGMRDVEAQAV
ncbi:MAG: helix-turn-helix domain-containing protein [Actinomycetota bacterium]|nr:helix-turn-helix domain-containing protein [Actinomycetota bacterium]